MSRRPNGRKVPGPRRQRPGRFVQIVLGVCVALASAYGWYGHQAQNAPDTATHLSRPNASNATEYVGRVVRVADGDSVDFQTAGRTLKIRLDSVDAPEIGDGGKRPGQPFAQQSREHLQKWLSGRTVTAHCYETDQYGRAVCALVDPTGASAGSAQVSAGFAWAYTAARGKYLRDASLPALQTSARQARRGLWQHADPIRPWQWRYDCWQNKQCR